MFPLGVIRFKLELMRCLGGCTKQKFSTTSTIHRSLPPVAASMICSVVGNSISVVHLTLARIATMSWECYCTVRADSCGRATMEETAKTALTMYFIFRIVHLLSGSC